MIFLILTKKPKSFADLNCPAIRHYLCFLAPQNYHTSNSAYLSVVDFRLYTTLKLSMVSRIGQSESLILQFVKLSLLENHTFQHLVFQNLVKFTMQRYFRDCLNPTCSLHLTYDLERHLHIKMAAIKI